MPRCDRIVSPRGYLRFLLIHRAKVALTSVGSCQSVGSTLDCFLSHQAHDLMGSIGEIDGHLGITKEFHVVCLTRPQRILFTRENSARTIHIIYNFESITNEFRNFEGQSRQTRTIVACRYANRVPDGSRRFVNGLVPSGRKPQIKSTAGIQN